MKVGHLIQRSSKAIRPLALLLLGCLAVIPLAEACGGEEEKEAVTPIGTPAATVVTTPAPAAEVPGITDTEIILGTHATLSGILSAFTAPISKTEEIYFRYVNDTQGGVCGRNIVLKSEDSQGDPTKAVEVVRKLVEQDKVFAIIGGMGEQHAAVWDYLKEKGVPDLFIAAGDHKYGVDPQGHPWSTQMIPDFGTEARLFAQYISENLPGKKVGVLYANFGWGRDALAALKAGLDPEINPIVSEQSFEISAVDIRPQVANMRNAGAEVVVLYAGGGFSAQLMKAADHMGWHPHFFMTYLNSDDSIFQFVAPELMKGVISFQALKLAVQTDDPAVARHYEIMRTYGGPTPTNFTIFGQALAEVTVEALKRSCDNLTREGVVDAVLSLKDYHSDLFIDGVNITFSDTDRTALQTGRMLRATVENGKGKWEYFGPLVSFGQ